MNTSVIILTRDRLADLRDLLDSLAQQTLLPGQIIIVDNSSNGATRAYLDSLGESLGARLRYLRGSPDLGVCVARNWAIDETQGDVVFFFDDDVVFTDPSYIETIVQIFEDDLQGQIGGVSGSAPSATPTSSTQRLWRLYLYRAIKGLFLTDWPRPARVLPSGFRSSFVSGTYWGQCLQGCAMALRREVLEEFRFDPALEAFMYPACEDQDLTYRASRKWRMLWRIQSQPFPK